MFSRKESSGGPALRTYAECVPEKKNVSIGKEKENKQGNKTWEKIFTIDNDVMK